MDSFKCVVPAIFLLDFASIQVEAKYCDFIDGNVSRYYCGVYEYCCHNGGCCPNFISFYRLWYFWFCIALILLFCSGGGYWYRKRYVQRVIVNQSPQSATIISMAAANQGPARNNYVRPIDGSTIGGGVSDNPPSYNQFGYSQNSQFGYPPGPYPPYTTTATNTGVYLTPQGVVYQVAYGPPPSYDSVYPTQHQGQGYNQGQGQ